MWSDRGQGKEGLMLKFQYIELHKSKVEQDIQLAYAEEIRQVLALGFAEEYYVCEKHGPFTRFLEADVVWRLSKYGGVWRTGPWWSLLIYGAFMLHEEAYAYATVVKDRIKFVTMFEEGTIVHTSSFHRLIRGSVPERKYIFQLGELGNVDKTWQMHQNKVREIANRGIAAVSLMNMHDSVVIETYIDEIQMHGERARLWTEHLFENNTPEKTQF
jgi:hypothetical protein